MIYVTFDSKELNYKLHNNCYGRGVHMIPPLFDCPKKATQIVEAAEKKGIVLRVMGSCAVRLHCLNHISLYKKFRREPLDIDLISYNKFESKIEELFRSLGYMPIKYISKFWERASSLKRHMYYDEKDQKLVDVFFDRLEMCHTIDFKRRLELDYPTITLADMLLQKMQIVKLTENDVKDMIILLREHDVGEKDIETINARYIAILFSKDWGFYHSAVMNLNRIKNFIQDLEGLSEVDHKDVAIKIEEILRLILKEPKSIRWNIRAKIGTRKKWYTEVEEPILPGTIPSNDT